MSVGLIAAFEKERSLVLSVPAATRTLREIGQRMHAKRKTRGGQAAEDMFCAKVCKSNSKRRLLQMDSNVEARRVECSMRIIYIRARSVLFAQAIGNLSRGSATFSLEADSFRKQLPRLQSTVALVIDDTVGVRVRVRMLT